MEHRIVVHAVFVQRPKKIELFASNNSIPLHRSINRLRDQIAPKLMLFHIRLFGRLFLLSCLFQIGKVLLCHDSTLNIRKRE